MHRLAWLKTVRVIVSIAFILLAGIIFLDPAQWLPAWFINSVTWTQFIPSFIRFAGSASLFAAGFLLFLILTFLAGRVYCSSVCPLGTLQDIISWIRRRFFKQRPLRYARARNILRYSILVIAGISMLFGISLIVNLLDPYSNFGRILANIVRPVLLFGGNGLAGLLEKVDLFWLPKTDFKALQVASLSFAAGFLLLLGWMSVFHGRLYCNTICPVGALLGLFSRFSVFKIRLDKHACNSCGSCSKVCKAQCIDVITKSIDYSRCVSCFNCLGACPSDGVLFSFKNDAMVPLKKSDPDKNNPRRTIIKAFLFSTAFLTLKAYATRVTGGEKPTVIPEDRTLFSTPPGSESHDLFNRNCTACHLCISVCPTQVLQPSFLQYGLQGFMQPYMDYHSGFCNFECDLCGQVCPTNAIKILEPGHKKLAQIGIAHFVKENCVVYTDNTDCGACSEHCPTKAVNMVPYKGALTIPEVNDKICIGCGACEYACPTKPYRAIFVEGNAAHKLAEEPVQDKIILKETEEDFPF